MENLFETRGIELLKVIKEAREMGNVELAETIEKAIAGVQKCYDVVAQKYTSTNGEELWKIDAEVLKARLK